MKSAIALFPIFLSSVMLVTGCEKIANFFPGRSGETSIKIFDTCFQSGRKAGSASVEAVKAGCIEKNQSKIPDVLEGRANYGACSPEDEFERDSNGKLVIDLEKRLAIIKNANVPRSCANFEGTLTNTSPKYVVTSVVIHVKFTGSTAEDSSTIDCFWLENGHDRHFSFPVNYKPTKLGSEDSLKEKFEWWTDSVKGFLIDY
jgi:hypothetical protein